MDGQCQALPLYLRTDYVPIYTYVFYMCQSCKILTCKSIRYEIFHISLNVILVYAVQCICFILNSKNQICENMASKIINQVVLV